MKFLSDDGDQHVNADGDPYLGLHGVVAGAVKALDAQVLFDPAEEQFDLRALGVKLRDGQRGKFEVVGEKNKQAVVGRVVKFDAAKFGRIIAPSIEPGGAHGLVAAHTGAEVDRMGIEPGQALSLLGPRDKKGSRPDDAIKACEIEIAAIHEIERARLEDQMIEPVYLVDIAGRDMDRHRDRSPQIELGVDLDRGFGRAKLRPGKETQAEIDRGGVERVSGLIQFDAEALLGVETAGTGDQAFGQVRVNVPRSMLVGVGQRAARHRSANPEMVKLRGARAQANLDVAETFPIDQLRESQAEKLIPAGEAIRLPVPVVALNTAMENLRVNPFHELGENHFRRLHPAKIACRRSCRSHPLSSAPSSSTITYNTACLRRLDPTGPNYE
jgi:hypothetical protein